MFDILRLSQFKLYFWQFAKAPVMAYITVGGYIGWKPDRP